MNIDDRKHLAICPVCRNCGELLVRHEKDSEPPFRCPQDFQWGSIYGYFCGGDPRSFHPDTESCSAKEIENHRLACIEANKLESRGLGVHLANPSKWVTTDEGKPFAHILMAPFGIGVTVIPDTYYEPDFGDQQEPRDE